MNYIKLLQRFLAWFNIGLAIFIITGVFMPATFEIAVTYACLGLMFLIISNK